MTKLYIIAGIVALLVALWLIKGILEAGAHRQEAIAHKIEIRRTNPIKILHWRERRKTALAAGQEFSEPEPVDVEMLDVKPGVEIEISPTTTILVR